MKNLKTSLILTGTAILLAGLVVSCTKRVPYKDVYKDKVENKADIKTDEEYLYVPSTDLSNHDQLGAAHAMPYWKGDSRLVKFRFSETTLQAVQVEEDARLKDNRTDEKVLMEIPINHIDYQCKEDHYKKCTNEEEENKDISWQQKTKFQPDFEKMKVTAVNMMPVEMDKVFGGSCYTEETSQFLNYELTPDSLNIKVQKTFAGDLSCLEKSGVIVRSMEDLQTQVIYHYSFARLSSVASPNYQKVFYPQADQGVYGFLKETVKGTDVDYTPTQDLKMDYLDRWSPEKHDIVYYLSDNFDKPEFQVLKKTAYDAFDKFNNGLHAAGLNLRLVLKDPAQKSPGDIRNNMVILVEDPTLGGPLGFGHPTVNPRTGEIISASVIFYYGNYLHYLRTSYEDVVREQLKGPNPAVDTITSLKGTSSDSQMSTNAGADSTAQMGAVLLDNVQGSDNARILSSSLQYSFKMADYMLQTNAANLGQTIAGQYNSAKLSQRSDMNALTTVSSAASLANISRRSFENLTRQTANPTTARATQDLMAKYCNYPAELFPFEEIAHNAFKGKLGSNLKFWKDLNTQQRQAVLDVLLPPGFAGTLVHELGHTVGLRHNFEGSEDKDNFYSKAELQKMGIHQEIPYSSVMDYGYSEINLLPTLGKYDIAALRFAYKREIETTDGKPLSISTTLQDLKKSTNDPNGDKLKYYKYCTDEQIEVNPNCKAFDKGTTYSEIVDSLIKRYDDLYEATHFRNGQENFSRNNDGLYYLKARADFAHIRAFMDRYKHIKDAFKIDDKDDAWKKIPFLKDLKEAALKSGRFFIRVLETPDIQCLVAPKSDPQHPTDIAPLSTLSSGGMDCFKDSKGLNTNYVVVGQTGRAFNDIKDPDSTNPGGDQIDIHGLWTDKIAAAEMLFKRRIGNEVYDTNEDNYTDMADLNKEVTTALTAMLLNQVEGGMEFKDANGKVVANIYGHYDVFSDPSTMKTDVPTHWIEAPISESVAKTVNLPMKQVSFQQVLLQIVDNSMNSSQSHWKQDQAFMNNFRIVKTTKTYALNNDPSLMVHDLGTARLVAMPENRLGQTAMKFTATNEMLNQLKPEQLKGLLGEIIKAASQPSGPAAAKSEFSDAYLKIPQPYVQAYLVNQLPSAAMMEYLMTILPASNP